MTKDKNVPKALSDIDLLLESKKDSLISRQSQHFSANGKYEKIVSDSDVPELFISEYVSPTEKGYIMELRKVIGKTVYRKRVSPVDQAKDNDWYVSREVIHD